MIKKAALLLLILMLVSCENNISSHLSDKEILEPTLFLPGIVTSLETTEFGMTISPIDAKKIFFTRRIGDEKQKIYETNFVHGKWTSPKIASFSTDRDESPQFSRDGKTIYFGSERPIKGKPNQGNFDMNVWKTTLISEKWTEPEVLKEPVNLFKKKKNNGLLAI